MRNQELPRSNCFLNGENVEDCADILDNHLVDDINKRFKQARPKPDNQKEGRKLKRKPVKGEGFSIESAQGFLPKITGCIVTNSSDDVSQRWYIKYPCKAPPYSKSCSFHKVGSQWAALFVCLRWVWAEHYEATKQHCPWDLFTVTVAGLRAYSDNATHTVIVERTYCHVTSCL